MDRELIQRLVALEWEFFQATRNEGGRAPCQDDRETFWVVRTGQAMGWSEEMAAPGCPTWRRPGRRGAIR